MLIKAGVDISRLNREIRRTLKPVSVLFNKEKLSMIITSTYEGNHSVSSLHYANDAYDLHSTAIRYRPLFIAIKRKLGPNFDVVFETTHIHVEYDPE